MKIHFSKNYLLSGTRIFVVFIIGLLSASCSYMKMNPPADADKAFLNNNNSCYLATASNMLGGAGYGDGVTLQARADDIYGDMTTQFGTANTGWTDTALSWWLGSANNTWTTNPYTVVTVYGNKNPKFPWTNTNGVRDIANELRNCNFVGVSISWPTNAVNNGNPVIGTGGHAITGWGDRSWMPWDGYSDPISNNPTRVRLTDSDTDTGGDVQQYNYDTYTNPNPGGANEGNGWYLDYSANHPYIKHIVTLTPTQTAGGATNIQRVVGSYRIHQDLTTNATDLHYDVGTDADILSYLTRVSWDTEATPDIQESQPQRRELDVDWDFSHKPIPKSNWVTITTEFILRNWNAISYDNVHFTYPDGVLGKVRAPVSWKFQSIDVPNAAAVPNVTGGYVVASFDIVDNISDSIVGNYRLLHQYSFTQSPEQHVFVLKGKEGFTVTNLRLGHSYGYLNQSALWAFENWMTDKSSEKFVLSDSAVELGIDWAGRLPYPEGEDIHKSLPGLKEGLQKVLPKVFQRKTEQ